LVNQPPLAAIRQIHYRRRGYGQSAAIEGPPESFMARAAVDAAHCWRISASALLTSSDIPAAHSSRSILRATRHAAQFIARH
jgi:hypothetical protein